MAVAIRYRRLVAGLLVAMLVTACMAFPKVRFVNQMSEPLTLVSGDIRIELGKGEESRSINLADFLRNGITVETARCSAFYEKQVPQALPNVIGTDAYGNDWLKNFSRYQTDVVIADDYMLSLRITHKKDGSERRVSAYGFPASPSQTDCPVSFPYKNIGAVCDGGSENQPNDDSLVHCGGLSPRDLAGFFEQSMEGKRYLFLETPGGSAQFARALADFADIHDLTIIFSGLCASACLNVLKHADKVHVGKDAVFLGHASPEERLIYIQAALKNAEMSQDTDISALEQGLAYTRALNPEVYDDGRRSLIEYLSALRTDMECAGGIVGNKLDVGVVDRKFHRTRYRLWLLSEKDIDLIKLTGPSPVFYGDYNRDAKFNLARYVSMTSDYTYVFSPEGKYDWEALAAQKAHMLKTAKLCERP